VDCLVAYAPPRKDGPLIPSPREAVGRGRGWGVPQQTRCQRNKLIDPPTPPHRFAGGGEVRDGRLFEIESVVPLAVIACDKREAFAQKSARDDRVRRSSTSEGGSNPCLPCCPMDCFAEPVIGRAFARPVGSQ